MGPKAATWVAGIIDRIEDRPLGTGRPPTPTIKVVETLRFFVREGVQWRELRATTGRASGSTLRRRLDAWSATAVLRRVHVAPGPTHEISPINAQGVVSEGRVRRQAGHMHSRLMN